MTTTDLPADLHRRHWLRGRPRPLRQTMVIDRMPRVQIAIFDDSIYLTRRQGQGWITYPIRTENLAEALGNLPTVSGLLPPNRLRYSRPRPRRQPSSTSSSTLLLDSPALNVAVSLLALGAVMQDG